MSDTHTGRCLTRTLAAATTENIKALQTAFEENRVIRSLYRRGNAGCLIFHLFGITSRQERGQYFSGDRGLFESTQHLITAWDQGMLDEEEICHELAATLIQREAINREEDKTIAAVGRRIANRLAPLVLSE